MDTHRLRYFLRIAEEGSINRAANALGIAQPALSRQIRLLEEDLGVTLFRRTARGVQLTDEGERLRAATAAPLRQLELAMRYVGSPLARIERGLHVGMPDTAARILATPLLDSLGAAFPRVDFRVSVASTEDLVESLLNGVVDIAVITPVGDGRLFYEDLLKEELFVIGGPMTNLHPDRPISFTELVELSLILPASQAGIRNSLENTALRLKLRLSSKFATDSTQVANDLIEAGHGYGVLPLSACTSEIEDKRLRYAPLTEPSLARQLGIAVAARLELPRGFSRKVGEIMQEEAARLIRSGAWAAQLTLPHGKPGTEAQP